LSDPAADGAPTTVDGALSAARTDGVARLDGQLLLARRLGRDRAWLIAHGDAPLPPAVRADFEALCRRRAAGEPLAYLTGQREFRGLTLGVEPSVLIPRPETEHLVDWALALRQGRLAGVARPDVVDLGTGSGAIALALASAWPGARVTAVDRSAAALAVARRNGDVLRLAVDWRHGDWWGPLAGLSFDLALSNPPYVADGDPHLPALRYEPTEALVGGPDGLAALRAIVRAAPAHLRPGGWLLLEHGATQAEAVTGLLRSAGFTDVETRQDLAGHPRCTGGRWPDRSPEGCAA
jgi:release factor glutamine methyltransferase